MRNLIIACLAPLLVNAHSSATLSHHHNSIHKRDLQGCYADNPSSLPPTVNFLQSSSACSDTCSGMTYAIINGNTCWCSDTPPQQPIPDQTCNYICPGSFTDSCGGPNVYAVYARDGGPASTDTTQAPDTTTNPKPTDTVPKTTKGGGGPTNGGKSSPDIDTRTVTAHGSTVIITSLVTPSSSLMPSSFGTVFITTTVGGSDGNATETATASPYVNGSLPNSDLNSGANNTLSTTNTNISKGGVAGIVIAVIVVIAAAAFFFGYRRRNQQSFATARDTSAASTSSPEMAGVAAEAAAGRSKWSTFRSRPAPTSQFRGPMDLRQSNSDSIIPTTTSPKPAHFRRTSTVTGPHDEEVLQQVVLPVDHRLDPRTMLMRLRESPGGESQTSLRDNMDYSRRVLHVVNGEESGDEE